MLLINTSFYWYLFSYYYLVLSFFFLNIYYFFYLLFFLFQLRVMGTLFSDEKVLSMLYLLFDVLLLNRGK